MMLRVVVPISGGKDSQACLKAASERFAPDEIIGLFCDTQFEHPLTYQHVERLRTLYGPIQIERVCGGSVVEKIRKYKRFPGGGARHCTDELKIRETRIFLKAMGEKLGHGFEVWYGMRFAESTERKNRYAGKISDDLYFPHEVIPGKYPKYLGKMRIMFKLPFLEQSEQDVIDYVGWENLNPLYHAGFPRVGCFPCQASGDKWKEKAYEHDDFGKQQYRIIKILSHEIEKPMYTSKGGLARDAEKEFEGCSLCAM